MKQKINGRMLGLSLVSMALTLALSFAVFSGIFDRQSMEDLEITAKSFVSAARVLGAGVSPADYAAMGRDGYRVTIISPTGQVLAESLEGAAAENHGARPEVRAALAAGHGQDTRRSSTSGIKTYYYAVLTDAGNVLRISRDSSSLYKAYARAVPLIIAAMALIAGLSAVVSRLLTKSLVRPIENMSVDIDSIDENIPYAELLPFARAIRRQQEVREEAGRMRQEFTANVSHELKTPLTSISGYAEMIETGMAKDGDVKDFAGKIRFEAGRLITLIGDIIQLNRLDDPEALSSTASVNLLDIAKSTVQYLGLAAEKADVTIRAEGYPVFIMGDKVVLEGLVYNLCDNAIRYNRPGGSVTVRSFLQGRSPCISVSDTGIGIPAEHQDRIFERFYRIDKSRSRESGGTGLGLAIVKHSARRHKAQIAVESRVGQGTTITIIFPTE